MPQWDLEQPRESPGKILGDHGGVKPEALRDKPYLPSAGSKLCLKSDPTSPERPKGLPGDATASSHKPSTQGRPSDSGFPGPLHGAPIVFPDPRPERRSDGGEGREGTENQSGLPRSQR